MGALHPQPYVRSEFWIDPRTEHDDGKDQSRPQSSLSKFKNTSVGAFFTTLEDYDDGKGLTRDTWSHALEDLGVNMQYEERLFGLFDRKRAERIDPTEAAQFLQDILYGPGRSVMLRSCFELFDPGRKDRVTQGEIDQQIRVLTKDRPESMAQASRRQAHVMSKLLSVNSTRVLTFDDFVEAVTNEPALLDAFLPHMLRLVADAQGDDICALKLCVPSQRS
eukprot:TRINITY_DN13282_c0_g1_i1.p1 TRINITY_DN13282_c0_g1~~TRINITY_DN13282_c0_g1_i1.p1  ORF type:complete len:221 (+),score=59.25 TRINITY_DN13282_c0_g1_i1:90-752(+)